jgi:hypothetical protein
VLSERYPRRFRNRLRIGDLNAVHRVELIDQTLGFARIRVRDKDVLIEIEVREFFAAAALTLTLFGVQFRFRPCEQSSHKPLGVWRNQVIDLRQVLKEPLSRQICALKELLFSRSNVRQISFEQP